MRARYASFNSCARDAANREGAFAAIFFKDAPSSRGSSMPEKSHSFRGAAREGARLSAAAALGTDGPRDALDSRSSPLREMEVVRVVSAKRTRRHAPRDGKSR